MESESVSGIRTWRFFWLMLFAVSLPMLVSHLSNLWSLEHYRYFPFVLLAVGWMLYTRWDREFRAPTGWIGWSTIFTGLLMTVLAVLVPSPWLASLGFLLFSLAFCSSILDKQGLSLIGAAVPLIMLVNLPLGFDQLLIIRLQQITTSLSSVALDVLAVPHAIENNVIRLASRDLFVAEACSGIQSVFTLMFVSTLLVAINRRLLWLTPVYLSIAILLAIFANVLRVTSVAVGDVWFGVDLAEGWQHELIGYTALSLGCLLLLSFDELLVGVLHPLHETADYSEVHNPIIRAWNFLVGANEVDQNQVSPIVWLSTRASRRGAGIWRHVWSGRAFMVVASVLLMASIGQAIHTVSPMRAFTSSSELVFVPSESAIGNVPNLTVENHQITREGADPRLGDNADIWDCRLDDLGLNAQFVVSQPYSGWHELCWCYTIQDWTLLSRIIRDQSAAENTVLVEVDSNDSRPYALAKFRVGDNTFAYLLYSAIDRALDPVDPPMRTGRLQGRFTQFLQTDTVAPSDLAMVQLLVVSDSRLDMDALERLNSHFVRLRQAVLKDARSDEQGTLEAVILDEKDSLSVSKLPPTGASR